MLDVLRCPRCGGRLELEILASSSEIDEGFMRCGLCSLCFPVMDKIPVIWDDFAAYLSERVHAWGDAV